MPLKIQDFQLKHGGTVLVIHLYMRAEQDIAQLQKNVLRAARGPQLDAISAWTEIYPPGRELGIEAEKFGHHRATVEKFLQASTRDVVVFHLYINTAADPQRLGENIRRAARGPRLDDVVSVTELYEGSEGQKVWGLIQEVARKVSAHPAAKSYIP